MQLRLPNEGCHKFHVFMDFESLKFKCVVSENDAPAKIGKDILPIENNAKTFAMLFETTFFF